MLSSFIDIVKFEQNSKLNYNIAKQYQRNCRRCGQSPSGIIYSQDTGGRDWLSQAEAECASACIGKKGKQGALVGRGSAL
jgi:hypothetical protein